MNKFQIKKEIIDLESKRSKLYYKIQDKEKELERLEEEQNNLEDHDDWEKFEGGCFLVESFGGSDGKISNYVYKIISTSPKQLHYEYADLEAEYLADWKDHQHSRGYKKWKKISNKEYENKSKGFKDLRKFASGRNDDD